MCGYSDMATAYIESYKKSSVLLKAHFFLYISLMLVYLVSFNAWKLRIFVLDSAALSGAFR
jgi:hypothetical protein